MSISFQVDNVTQGTFPSGAKPQIAREFMGFEASSTEPVYRTNQHPLLEAVRLAYDRHLPLFLSPDDIWLTIAQGFSDHVNSNAEALRSRFVQHEGRKEIHVELPFFVKGSPDNPWQRAFPQFSDQVREHIGKAHNLLVGDFTTTTPTTRAAFELTLMDAMQAYFEYWGHTRCGFPLITLGGTQEDWENIQYRVQALAEYDQPGTPLRWWTDPLQDVVAQFVQAYSAPDLGFWRSMCKTEGGSGGPYINGWINALFPYARREGRRGQGQQIVSRMGPQYNLASWMSAPKSFNDATPDIFGDGMRQTPFIWDYYQIEYDYFFASGFVGIAVESRTQTVSPVIGWGVKEKGLRASGK